MKFTKAYLTVTAVITAILIGVAKIFGNDLTLISCGNALLFSAIATAIVMAIWFIVGLWICTPIVKFLNRIFELAGR